MTGTIFVYPFEGHVLRFQVRPSTDDVNIIQEVATSDYYSDGRALLTKHSTVIDIGGHIGSYSILSAVRGARVVALEPVPRNFEMLNENVRLNGLQERVTTINAAVWSSTGEQTLGVADDSTGGSSFWCKKPTVPQIAVRHSALV